MITALLSETIPRKYNSMVDMPVILCYNYPH